MLKTDLRHWKLSTNSVYSFFMIAILVLAIALRLLGLNKGLWLDEFFSLRWLDKGDLWETTLALRVYNKPPLYFLLLYGWSQINNSEPFLRLLSIIFDLGTVIIVIKWLKSYSRLSSILAGLYLASTPIMLRYAQEIRPYSLLVFTTTLSFFFVSQIIKQPQNFSGYLGLSLSLSLAIATHLVAFMLLIPIAFVLVAAMWRENLGIYWQRLISIFCLPSIVFSFFYFFYLQELNQKPETWWMPGVSGELLSSTTRYVFGLPQLVLFLWDNHLNVGVFLVILLILCLVAKNKVNFSWLCLISASLFWLQIITYSILKVPVFWYRIVFPGLIPFIAFVTLQVSAIKLKKIKLFYTLGIVGCSLIFTYNWVVKQAYQPVEEFREVTQIVDTQWQPGDVVVIYPEFIYGLVDYYFDRVPPESRLVVYGPHSFQEIDSILARSNEQLQTAQNIYFIVRSIDLDHWQTMLTVLKSQIEQPTTVHLISIENHDNYFTTVPNTKEKLFLSTQQSLGEPLYHRDEELFSISKWKL